MSVLPDGNAATQFGTLFQAAVDCHQRGDLPRASMLYRDVLRQHPSHADAWHLLGVVAAQTNQPAVAVQLIERAIAYDPANFAAYGNLGSALHAMRRLPEALSAFDHAIALKSDYADAHFNRGHVLKELQQTSAALASYDRAIASKPDFDQAFMTRGNLCFELKYYDAALASYEAVLARKPECAEAHSNRGNALQALGRLEEALASYDKALELKPDFAEAHANKGNVLRDRDRFDDALASYHRALAIDPDCVPAHFNRGVLLNQLRRLDAALRSYDAAIAIDPQFAEAHFNKAILLLLTGDYARGWVGHEWRWKNRLGSNVNERREFKASLWRGEESLRGRSILLYGEQGFGDTLQFCRYVTLVAELGAQVILEVPKPLERLLAGLRGVSELVVRGSVLPPFDYQCPLMSLPLAFKTELETIPSFERYLSSDPAKVAEWQERLGTKGTPRVGLMWNGNPAQPNDRHRSVWLADWLPYLPTGIQYVSLQRDLRPADAITLDRNPQIMNPAGKLFDFSDTAALCDCMDLVVSVCTSVAHLSGALGKKTFIMLTHAADWRWLLERTDSPWYPSATLYRQPTRGDWSAVFQGVESDLRRAFPQAMAVATSSP